MFTTRMHNEWFTLSVDESERILRLRRSAKKVQAIEDLKMGMERLIEAIDHVVPTSERARWALLQDMRAAPLLDNPDWEAEQLRYAGQFRSGWRRSALLVQTAIGKLQAKRLAHSPVPVPVAEVMVFDDEIAALNSLRLLS
jgi:hypothetical protein